FRLSFAKNSRVISANRSLGRAARGSGVGMIRVGRRGDLVHENAPPPLIELAAASKVHFLRAPERDRRRRGSRHYILIRQSRSFFSTQRRKDSEAQSRQRRRELRRPFYGNR